MARPHRLSDLGRMAPLAGALVPHGFFDAVHLLLVSTLVLHSALLGLLQCTLQGLNSLSRSPKSFFQFRKLTTQICIVTYQLFVNLCKLFQVVLKKGDLLLLGMNPPTVLGLHFCTFLDSSRDVLNEQLAKVVEGLEFTGNCLLQPLEVLLGLLMSLIQKCQLLELGALLILFILQPLIVGLKLLQL